MIEATTDFADATCKVVRAGCVMAASWRDAPSLPQMQAIRRASEVHKRECAGGTALVNLILDGTPRFDDEVRAEAVAMTRAGVHKLGTVHCVTVDGLRGAATRAFLNTIALVGKARAPTKVVASIDDACKIMVPWIAGAPGALGLDDLRALAELAVAR